MLSSLSQIPHTVSHLTWSTCTYCMKSRTSNKNHQTLTQPSEWKICNSCCLSSATSIGQFSSSGVGRSCHEGTIMSLTSSLTPWSWVLFEKLTGPQLVKKFPAFYGTWRFITAFTSTCHSQINPVHASHPTYWRSILILSSHIHLGLPSGLFPSGFPIKILYTPLFSPICATCRAHLILLDLITQIIFGEEP